MRFLFIMNLSEWLVVRMGRITRDHVANRVRNDDVLFSELVQLVHSGSKTQRMKGAWVLSGIHLIDSNYLQSHYPIILERLKSESVGGVKRELLRCFQGATLSEEIKEQLVVIAMNWVTDERQDLAVRYLCYRLLTPLLRHYHELQSELSIQVDLYQKKFGRFP